MYPNKAVFLDRDGTLNQSVPYLDDYSKFIFYSDTIEALQLLDSHGFMIVIITNQSGIGRGFFSTKKLDKIHNQMKLALESQKIPLSGIFFCPHTPEENCQCRKPNIGMLEKASEELLIDPLTSYFVGDRLSDIQAGQSFGCSSILVMTGYGESESNMIKDEDIKPDNISENILEAAKWIVNF